MFEVEYKTLNGTPIESDLLQSEIEVISSISALTAAEKLVNSFNNHSKNNNKIRVKKVRKL